VDLRLENICFKKSWKYSILIKVLFLKKKLYINLNVLSTIKLKGI
jgi:hypothetical protein